MSIGFVIGAVCGAIFGLLITGLIVMSLIRKSNDWGDLGNTEPSMTSFNVVESNDKVRWRDTLEELMANDKKQN